MNSIHAAVDQDSTTDSLKISRTGGSFLHGSIKIGEKEEEGRKGRVSSGSQTLDFLILILALYRLSHHLFQVNKIRILAFPLQSSLTHGRMFDVAKKSLHQNEFNLECSNEISSRFPVSLISLLRFPPSQFPHLSRRFAKKWFRPLSFLPSIISRMTEVMREHQFLHLVEEKTVAM